MIINNVAWRVRMVSPSHPLLLTPWRTHALGVCDKITQTIYIDKTYDEEEMVAEIISEYGEQIMRLTNFIYDGIKTK